MFVFCDRRWNINKFVMEIVIQFMYYFDRRMYQYDIELNLVINYKYMVQLFKGEKKYYLNKLFLECDMRF